MKILRNKHKWNRNWKEPNYSTISDITISAGDTTGTASFTPTDDSTFEGNETGIVAISGLYQVQMQLKADLSL